MQDMAGDIDLNLNFSNLLILSCSSLDILFSRSHFSPYKTIPPSPSSSASALGFRIYTYKHQHSSTFQLDQDGYATYPPPSSCCFSLLLHRLFSSFSQKFEGDETC